MSRAILLTLLALVAAPAAQADLVQLERPPGDASWGDLAVDTDGRLLANDGYGRVRRFSSPGGAYIDAVGEGVLPTFGGYAIAAAPDGGIVASRDSETWRFRRDGALDATFGWGGYRVAVDGAGAIYTTSGEATIVPHAADGTARAPWAVTDAAGGSLSVDDLAAVGNTVVVLAQRGNGTSPATVLRFRSDGTLLSRWTAPEQVVVYGGWLGVDAAGAVYIQAAAGGTIHKLSPDGVLLGSFDVFPRGLPRSPPLEGCAATGFDSARAYDWRAGHGLAVGLASELYTIDESSRIWRADDAPISWVEHGPSHVPASFDPTFAGPSSLTGDPVLLDASRSSMPFGMIVGYEWDLDGDGTFETDTGDVPTATAAFGHAGLATPRVRLTGSNGSTTVADEPVRVADSRALLDVAGREGKPSAVAIAGQGVPLTAARSLIKPLCSSPTVTWDVDGDGTFERDTGTSVTTTATFTRLGVTTPRVRIQRLAGRADVAALPVDVRPAPPAGPVGLTIDDEAIYTNDPQVELGAVWPKYATQALVSDDGSFRRAARFPLTPTLRWRLPVSGAERIPKHVYVRFVVPDDGYGNPAAGSVTYSDDIILDTTEPVVTSARLATRTLTVGGRDATSGAGAVQVASNRKKPGKAITFAKKTRGRRTFSQRFAVGRGIRYVRVLDRAGNRSAWKRLGR